MEFRVKKLLIVSSCAAFVLSVSGCGIDDCSGVQENGQRLASDLGTLYRTTKTYEMVQDDGVLRIEITYDDGSSGWDALSSRGTGTRLMMFLSDLLIPSAYADCAPAVATMELTYTARWSTVEGVSIVLAEDAPGTASYMDGARSGDVYFSAATSLTIEGDAGSIDLVSLGGSAQSFELVRYFDRVSRAEYAVTFGCPEGVSACVDEE